MPLMSMRVARPGISTKIPKDTIGCEVMTYECPNCGVELANNEEDALAFLKGEISEEMATYFLELALEGGEK